ncbi:hypothetical protein Pcinc_030078 [Petrolisthes cinctipes]|uniref:Ionotropic glutamate receptor C-terminal domain-containing protein n=1 Tax=Petrolisthes cinctipes TaxID=88211 RepID=A0AAE1K6U9_PETCI|nr:hypothetical protein Pcinc_030078 [Petrolisthes cinctipes]
MTMPVQLSVERLDKSFEVSRYIFIEKHSAGYSRPAVTSDITGFIKPFTPWVWLLVLVTVVGVIVSLLLLSVARQSLILYHRPNISQNHLSATTTTATTTATTTTTTTGEFTAASHFSSDNVWLEGNENIRKKNEERNEDMSKRNEAMNEDQFEHPLPLILITRDAVMWTVSGFLQQAVSLQPPRGVVKVMTGLWLLLSLILATVYRGNLKAMLILPSISLPFNTLEELVSSGLPVWVPLDSLLHIAAYHAEVNSTLGRFNRSIFNADRPNNVTWGIIDYIAGKHVLSAPRSAMLHVTHAYYSKSGICTNFIMKETFLSPFAGVFIYPKGSPLKAKLDFIIQGLQEFGILDYLYNKALSNATECLKPIKVKSGRALDVGDFYGVFSIYAGGRN